MSKRLIRRMVLTGLLAAVMLLICGAAAGEGNVPTNPYQQEIWEFDRESNLLGRRGTRAAVYGVTLTPVEGHEPALGQTGQWTVTLDSSLADKTITSVNMSIQTPDADGNYSTVYKIGNPTDPVVESCTFVAAGSYRIIAFYYFSDGTSNAGYHEFTLEEDGTYPSLQGRAAQIVSDCQVSGDAWQTALNLHDWLTTNAHYDSNYEYYGADGVLLRGYGVCDSYSKAYVLLCQAADISVSRVTGNAGGGAHAWNAIQLAGEWYLVDATWDDPLVSGKEYDAVSGYERHDYFCLNDELMSLDHTRTSAFSESCTSLDANWLLRSGDKNQMGDNIAHDGSDSYTGRIKQALQQLTDGETVFQVDCEETYYIYHDSDEGWISWTSHGAGTANATRGWTLLAAALSQTPMTLDDGTEVHISVTYNVPENCFLCELEEDLPTEGACGENVTWALDENGQLAISGTGDMYDYNSANPAPWNALKDNITYVTIWNGVTSIGAYAFDGCGNLISADIKNGVTRIGSLAFNGCRNMISVTLPESITEIGPGAFQFCLGLTHVAIPRNLSVLGMSVFQQCQNLATVTFPSGITSIERSAFYNCYRITDVYYTGTEEEWNAIEIHPDNNESVINAAKHFNTARITDSGECGADGDNVTWTMNDYGDLLISGTGAMADYNRENKAPWRWFTGNTTEVTVGEGVTRIGSMAFYYATELKRITIPSTLESIGENAFDGCIRLETVFYSGNEAQWTDIAIQETGNSALRNAVIQYMGPENPGGSCGENLTWVFEDDGTLTISGTGEMYDYDSEWEGPWFDYRDQVRSVVIEDGVTAIGQYAFYRHTQLETVLMADSITLIGEGAFRGNIVLTDIQFSNGLLTIDDYAFEECETLSSVTLPDGLETIGYMAFTSCNLSGINIPEGVPSRTWDFFYEEMNGQDYLCHLTLPESVTSVGFGAFCENPVPHDLPDYLLPEDLTTIEAEAFAGSNPRFIWIPDGVTAIGDNAFAACENLEYVYIPFGCESIGENAFPAGTRILGIRIYDLEPCAAQDYADQNGLTFMELEAPFSGNG